MSTFAVGVGWQSSVSVSEEDGLATFAIDISGSVDPDSITTVYLAVIGGTAGTYSTAQRRLDTHTRVNGKNVRVNSMNICQICTGTRHNLIHDSKANSLVPTKI